RLGVAIALVILASGCSVKPEDLEKWKTTQKGPDKLTAVLLDDKYDADLRAVAAVALADIGEFAQWDMLEKSFKVIEEPQRSQIIDAIVPSVEKMMTEGTEPPSPPLQSQVSGKDLAHLVYPYSQGESKSKIEDLLVAWCVADFNHRFFIGRKSIDIIIMDVGEKAAGPMVDLLGPDSEVYDKVTEYLDKIATEEIQHKAGATLIGRARQRMKNYDGKIDQSLLVSLGRMGGPEVRAFLLENAGKTDLPSQTSRGSMMAYLQFEMWHKDDVETLFAIAESTDQDYSVRNWSYDAIVATGDKANKDRIARLLHTTSEDGSDKDRFRGVGVDELLKLLGTEGIPFIIEEVIVEEDPWDDWLDLRDYVPVRLVQGKDGKLLTGTERKKALELLRPFLEHKESMARGMVAYAIGLVGEKSDLEKLESMKKDKAKLDDWKYTQGEEVVEHFPNVGSVAEWAVNKINEGG
ncbi:MAG: hypothetical protein JRG91_16205, partial [Deltaproteobacteria bacterium]|nr:hypothetical protein [Deltaproteobacteria bacterium]